MKSLPAVPYLLLITRISTTFVLIIEFSVRSKKIIVTE